MRFDLIVLLIFLLCIAISDYKREIMKDCKMSRTTLHKHITRLKKEGRIR